MAGRSARRQPTYWYVVVDKESKTVQAVYRLTDFFDAQEKAKSLSHLALTRLHLQKGKRPKVGEPWSSKDCAKENIDF